MKEILVIFGSKSDSLIFTPLIHSLREKYSTSFYIISAHRDTFALMAILKKSEEKIIIAGAGLAAHLPGVIASLRKDAIVLGIPVICNFEGIDSFSSILQMPKGVPVLASSPNNYKSILFFIDKLHQNNINQRSINIIVKDRLKVTKYFEQVSANSVVAGIDYTFSSKQKKEKLNIVFTDSESDIDESFFSIYVPIVDCKIFDTALDFLNVFKMASKGGMWIGVNNIQNAFLFAKKILTHTRGRYDRTSNFI